MTTTNDRNGMPKASDALQRAFQVTLPRLVEKLLPKHLPPDRFLRSAWISVQEVPDLLGCSVPSFIVAVLQAAVLELELGSARGLAYVLPYKKKAKLVPGYKGYLQLGRRAGLLDWQARPVFAGDEFRYNYGTTPEITHIPKRPASPEEAATRELVAAYSIAWVHEKMPPNFRVLEAADVLARKAVSQGADRADSPWMKWEAEMWAKTAMRAHAPHLPQDERLAAALELDTRADVEVQRHMPILDDLALGDVAGEAADDAAAPITEAGVRAEASRDRMADLRAKVQAQLTQGPAKPIEVKQRATVEVAP